VTLGLAALMAAFLGTGAAFHFYWGFGGRAGLNVAVPHRAGDGARGDGAPLFTPGPFATLGVAVALSLIVAALAVYVLGATFLLPRGVWRIGMAAIGCVFLLRGFSWHPYFGLFKRVYGTAFARNDTWFYSPGCVATGAGFLWLAWVG
jgi:hypothetical protein